MGKRWKEFRQQRRDRRRKAAEKGFVEGTESLSQYQADRTYPPYTGGA